MPRYNVEYDGKWACYTSISDGFVTKLMDKVDYEEWRKVQYGTSGYQPAEECNRMTIHEAISSMKPYKSQKKVMAALCETGISEEVAIRLMGEIELS